MAMPRRIVLPLVALAVLAGSTRAAEARCTLRKSCTKPLFRCFKPKGACVIDTQSGVSRAVCWANGAKVEEEFGTGGTITVLGKKGKPCAIGTTQRGPNGEFQVAWTRKNKAWLFTSNLDRTKSFTCPSAKQETYSAADFTAGEICGRIPMVNGTAASACTEGLCP
jgi:hypothetical protein